MGYIKRHKRGFNCVKHLLCIEPTEEQKVIMEEDRVIKARESNLLRTKLGMVMATTGVLSGITDRY